jgi:hypothetical protein
MRGENRVRSCPECGQRLYFDHNTLSWTCTNPTCKKVYKYEESDAISVTRGDETRHGRSRPHLEAGTDNYETYRPDVYGGPEPSHGSSHGHRTTYELEKKSRRAPTIIGVTLACIFAAVTFIIITDPFTPTLAANPLGFAFSVSDGLDPHTRTLELESSGRAITWFAIDDASWLNLDPIDGNADEETALTLSVDIWGMYPGEYTATITIYASNAKNELIEIPVSLVITETEETLAIKEAVGGNENNLGIHYDEAFPYRDVRLINNPSATNPTFGQLLKFIASDITNEYPYVEDEYMCADFAETLHNNAEQEGIRAAWVSIDFEGETVGHALNAFCALGTGLVFVDCTGGGFEVLIPSSEYDAIAYVRVGEQYGLVSSDTSLWPSYDFYERYLQDWEDCERRWEDYARRVEEYNEWVDEYNALAHSGTVDLFEYWRLKAISDELEAERIDLESLSERLGDYRWEAKGVVSHVEIYW